MRQPQRMARFRHSIKWSQSSILTASIASNHPLLLPRLHASCFHESQSQAHPCTIISPCKRSVPPDFSGNNSLPSHRQIQSTSTDSMSLYVPQTVLSQDGVLPHIFRSIKVSIRTSMQVIPSHSAVPPSAAATGTS